MLGGERDDGLQAQCCEERHLKRHKHRISAHDGPDLPGQRWGLRTGILQVRRWRSAPACGSGMARPALQTSSHERQARRAALGCSSWPRTGGVALYLCCETARSLLQLAMQQQVQPPPGVASQKSGIKYIAALLRVRSGWRLSRPVFSHPPPFNRTRPLPLCILALPCCCLYSAMLA